MRSLQGRDDAIQAADAHKYQKGPLSLANPLGFAADVQALSSCIDVLVTPPAQVDDDLGPIGHSGAELVQIGKRMRCLQGRDNAFQPADLHE